MNMLCPPVVPIFNESYEWRDDDIDQKRLPDVDRYKTQVVEIRNKASIHVQYHNPFRCRSTGGTVHIEFAP